MEDREALINYLGKFITENKRNKIQKVLQYRTRFITLAMEDIYQSQNASAVLRSCDCFGIQEAHIIENDNKYKLSPNVTQGAEKWVDIIRHNSKEYNTTRCIEKLRKKGYTIVATIPHQADYMLGEFPLEQKTALFLGTELEGLTDTALQKADYTLQIPMYGFTQSFNLSVCAAIILYRLTEKMYNSSVDWELTEVEKQEITLNWYRNILSSSDQLEERFYKEYTDTGPAK
jgi:tRNA (guanosine-2'-O-)-methyltransferase